MEWYSLLANATWASAFTAIAAMGFFLIGLLAHKDSKNTNAKSMTEYEKVKLERDRFEHKREEDRMNWATRGYKAS